MNDNSKFEFENKFSSSASSTHQNLQLIQAQWSNEMDNSSADSTPSRKRPTVRYKTPLTDVNNDNCYPLPNGKWKPLPTINVAMSHDVNTHCNTSPMQENATILHAGPMPMDTKPQMPLRIADKFGTILQTDSGANICATGDKSSLLDYEDIPARAITSVNRDESTSAEIIGYGYIYMKTIEGNPIKVKVYYSPNIDNTIISPQAIARQYHSTVQGWYQYVDIDNDQGTLGFSM